MATKRSDDFDSDEPSAPPGTTKLVQVRNEPNWQWRNCRLNNGVWEPDEDGWNDGSFGAKSPGLFLTTGKRVSGPPQNSWSRAWGKLVVPPRPIPISSATALLDELKKEVAGQDVHEVILEREQAKHGSWPKWVGTLKSRGIHLDHAKPFQHQADALQQLDAGNHVVIGTGTASGKSLCFQLPVLRTLLAEPAARALYVSPMKALCADQLEAWADLLGADVGAAHYFDAAIAGQQLRVLRYDRDVKEQTIEHAADAQVVLTNSSMLHYMLAGAETKWRSLFSALRYVVVDEVHTARGVVGANVAWIIRRLRRAAWRLSGAKSEPQFVFCSATIGNPDQLARILIGDDDQRPFSSVSEDTSGRARRVFVSWTPKGADDGFRRVTVLPDLVQALLDRADGPIQTITFHRSRPEANLVGRQCAHRLTVSGRDDLAGAIEVYISNVAADKKRPILDALRSGDCPAVFATPSLELGIDIGNLSAAIIMGIPFSRTGFRQMAGRVGRRAEAGSEAIVIYVPRDDPLHDWYAKKDHFERELVRAKPEDVPTDPDNEVISRRHLIAAAKELQPTEEDGRFFGTAQDGSTPTVTAGQEMPLLGLQGPRSAQADQCARNARQLRGPDQTEVGRGRHRANRQLVRLVDAVSRRDLL
jgi:DEAD/DEAH box helicase domain-containing protein